MYKHAYPHLPTHAIIYAFIKRDTDIGKEIYLSKIKDLRHRFEVEGESLFFFFCSVQTEAEIIIFLFCFFVFVFHPKTIITFLNWFHSFLVAAQCENLSLLTSHEIKEKKCNTLKKISLINFVHFGLKRKLSSYSSHFPFTKGHTFFYCSSL